MLDFIRLAISQETQVLVETHSFEGLARHEVLNSTPKFEGEHRIKELVDEMSLFQNVKITIEMETSFRGISTLGHLGICWEFCHGYTVLEPIPKISWEELCVQTELKTQDVRDTHCLAGHFHVLKVFFDNYMNKLLFYNHTTQVSWFHSQWIMKFPRFPFGFCS